MEGKRRQKGERLIITKKQVESTSKGGQKCRRERQRKRGRHDSKRRAEDRSGGIEEKLSSEKREQEKETYVTLTNGRE